MRKFSVVVTKEKKFKLWQKNMRKSCWVEYKRLCKEAKSIIMVSKTVLNVKKKFID